MTSQKNYKVGYGRPPTHSRYKPGTSGNPSGRPRGHKNLTKLVRDSALGRIKVKEGDRVRVLARFEALLRTMWAQAFKGDPKALAFILQSMRATGLLRDEPLLTEPETTPDDQEILREFLKRLGGPLPTTSDPAQKSTARRRRRA